jgi:hypothetical protein
LVASFSAAFIFDSPFRSPFSDIVKTIFRIFPKKPIPGFQRVLWRTFGIVLVSVLLLAPGGYLIMKQNYVYFVFIFIPIASVFALMREGRETDMQPRLCSLPVWVFISFVTVSVSFSVSSFFHRSTHLCVLFFVLASTLLCFQGYVGIKMSETRPMTVEAEAVSWFLTTSSNKDPAWFQKAVEIAGQSPNVRPVLLRRLFPLLVSSLPKHGQADVTSEQEGYINTLATLMDFESRKWCLWRNEASLERPTLPEGLIDTLKKLRPSGGKCSHTQGLNDQATLWSSGTIRCPQACVSNAVEHILQLHALDEEKNKDEQDGNSCKSAETV